MLSEAEQLKRRKRIFAILLPLRVIVAILGVGIWLKGNDIARLWLGRYPEEATFLPDPIYTLWAQTHGPGAIPALIAIATWIIFMATYIQFVLIFPELFKLIDLPQKFKAGTPYLVAVIMLIITLPGVCSLTGTTLNFIWQSIS